MKLFLVLAFLGVFLLSPALADPIDRSDLPFPAPFLATPSPMVDGRTDFLAHHPGHDLSVLVTPEGTAFQNEFGGNVFFTYGVKRVGQDQPLLHPGEFLGTDAHLNSVTLRRSVLSERVDTLPEGIKQTFLLHERPEGDGAFALVMGVGGSFHKLSVEPDRLHFASDCGHRMVYEDLLVFDAKGTVLEASFQEGAGDHSFLIVVNDQNAVYPIEIDPVFRPFRTENDSFRHLNTRPSDQLTLTEEGTILKMDGDLLAVGVPGFDLFPMRNTDNVRKSALNVAGAAAEGARGGSLTVGKSFGYQLQMAMQVLGFMREYRINDVGAVYVFSLVEGSWQLLDVLNDWAVAVRYDQANFNPTRLDGSRFGETLALKNRRIMVGAPGIKSETWVNVLIQVRVAGPHTIGGLYFFEQPHTGDNFFRRNWFYGIRSELGTPDLVTGAGLTDYTEVGRAVALDDSRAVVTSGGGFNPNQIGGQYGGYGPTKFHHFVRDGVHWQKHPDIRTATDLPGQVVHLALIKGMVLAVEEYGGATRLWRHNFPETPSALQLIMVRSWPDRSGSRFDADEDGFVLSFPEENEVYTGEVMPESVVVESLTLPPSLSQSGRAVARGNQSLLFTADLDEEERLWLYNRSGDTPTWQMLTSQALSFHGGARAVGISDAGVAVMGPHADNASHTDLLVYSLNRSISGRVFHPNGQPIHAGFRLGLKPEPAPIPAQAARLFDGANMVPFAGPSWTLNDPRNSALLFSVNDNFPFLDNYLLEITFSHIPPEIRGQEAQLSVRLPLQTFTWGGQERLDQPGFGGGRVTLTEGTHLVDLFGWWAGGFQGLMEETRLQTAGQWEILFAFPGSQRGVPYARVESANLLLVENDAYNRRLVTTDSSGNFRFDNLPPGRYQVVPDPSPFSPQDFKGTSETVDLASNPFVSGVHLNLEAALSLSGRALTVGGHPIPDLEFEIVTPSGIPIAKVTARTQPDGTFRVSNLVSGWHRYETTGVWQAPSPFNSPYTMNAWVSWWRENETDFIIPPTVLSPEIQVRDASGQPAANTRFRVSGPFGYRQDLISDANGQVRLPGVPNNAQFFTPPKPLLYPGEYILQGTDSRFDWSEQPTRLTLPAGQDDSGNPLTLPPLQAVGSEVKVSLRKAGVPFADQYMLMVRVTDESPVLLEQFTAETLQHAVFFQHQRVITLPSIHIAAEPFDRLESIEVLHTGGIQELMEGAELENPGSLRYDLILPDGRALPLSEPVLGLYSMGDWPESKFFTRKMVPEGSLFDREFWPAGEYRLRITYDDNAMFRNVWDHWALRIQLSRRQFDNEFIARADSEGNAFFPGTPGGQYVVTPAVRDSDHVWRNALELEPSGWIYSLDLMEIPSGVTRFELTKEVQQLHQISGSFFTSTLRPPFVEVRAVHTETGEVLASTLGDTIGNFSLEGVPSGPVSLDLFLEGYAFFSENVTEWDPLTENISGLQVNAFLDTSLTGTLLRPDGEAAADIPLILRTVDRFFPGEPMSFPGLTWRELPLEIDTGVTIDDLSVHYNANYTHETIYLVHPDGTAINLVRPNYFVFGPKVFNDAFEKPRYDGTQFERGREGRVGPSDPLATFRGRPAGGTWRLRIYGATSGQVHVSSWGLSIRPQLPFQNNLNTTFFSDDAGEFALTDIPPGFFELAPDTDSLIIELDQTEFDFSRQSHDTFIGTVTRPSVRVTLTDESGDPAAGVTVFVNIDGTLYEGDTDANGNAEVFLPDLRPGEVFIAQGEQVYGEPASLPLSFEGSTPEVEFTLLEKATPMVQVDLAHEQPTYPFEVRSDSFTLESSVPGTLLLSPEPGTFLDAGTQRVEWTFTPQDNRLNRAVSGHLDIEVARADAGIMFESLTTVYTGDPLEIAVSTLPEGLPIQILYPEGIPPLAAGLYPVELRVDTDNYSATKSAIFEVQRAPASLQIPEAVNGRIVRRIDDPGDIPLATTDPSELGLTFVFRSVESPETPLNTLPVEIGTYLLTVTHDSDNFFEETTVEFQLLPSLVTVAFNDVSEGSIIRTFTGDPQELPSVTTTPGGVRVEYLFSGTQNNGETYGPISEPPVRAGIYTVTATVAGELVEGSASAEFRIERAPLVLEQIQSPGALPAGVAIDLDSYFQSNAERLRWSVSNESEANGRFIHQVLPWGFSENYPLEVLEMSGGPFGGGGALLANSQARAWTFSNPESFTGSDVESVTTGNATQDMSLIWTIGLNGEVARSGLSFTSEAPQVLGVLPLEMRGNIVQFEAGPHHALVLDRSGRVALFTASAAPSALQTPPEIINQTKFVSIASGSRHVLLLTDEGDLYAWGEDDHNQLVLPDLGPAQAVQVFAGPVSSHALLSDGRLVSWGTPVFADAQPLEGRLWISVAAGEQYVALLDNEGEVHLEGRISPSLQPWEMSQSPVHDLAPAPLAVYGLRRTSRIEPRTSGELILEIRADNSYDIQPGSMVSVSLPIEPRSATVLFDAMEEGIIQRTFSSEPASPPAVTTLPGNLPVVLSYSGVSAAGANYGPSDLPPTDAGNYLIEAIVDAPHYVGGKEFDLVIEPAVKSSPFIVSGTSLTYNGENRFPVIQTVPGGLNFEIRSPDGSPFSAQEPGTYPFTVNVIEPNYQGSLEGELVIHPAPSFIYGISDFSHFTFGTQDPVLPVETTTGLPVQASVLSGPGLIESPNTLVVEGAGIITIQLEAVGSPRFGAVTRTVTFEVTPQSADVQIVLPDSPVFTGSPWAVNAITTPADLPVLIEYANGLEPPVQAGSHPVTARIVSPDYTGEASATLTIAKAPVSFLWLEVVTFYDGEPQRPRVDTEPSNLDVVLQGPFSEGDPVYGGTYTFTATASGLNHFGTSSTEFTIQPRPQSISFAPPVDMTYGDAPQPLSASLDSGRPVRFDVVSGDEVAGVDADNRLVAFRAGEVVVRAREQNPAARDYAPADPVEYTVQIARKEAPITLTLPSASSMVYDGSPWSAIASTDGKIFARDITLLYNGVEDAPVMPGTYEVEALGQNDLYFGQATATFTIQKASTAVQIESPLVFTGNAATPSVTTTPEDLTVLTRWVDRESPPVDVGTYVLEVEVEDPRYEATVLADVTILPRPLTIEAAEAELVFTGSPQTLEILTDPPGVAVTQEFFAVDGPQSFGSTITEPGEYTALIEVADANYTGVTNLPVSIVPADVTLSLEGPETFVYNGLGQRPAIASDPAGVDLDWTLLQEGEPVSAAVDAGTYSFTVSPGYPGFSGVLSGEFTIQPAPLAISLTSLTTAYDGSSQAPAVQTLPEEVAVSFAFSQEGAAVSEGVNAGIYTLEISSSNPNYTGSVTEIFTIERAPIQTSWEAPASVPVNEPTTLTALASNGYAVEYTLISGDALLVDGVLTLLGSGPVVVSAQVPGDENYLAADPIEVTVNPLFTEAQIAVSDLFQVYNGGAIEVDVKTTPAGRALEILYDGSPTPPVQSGSVEVSIRVVDPGYLGHDLQTLVIQPAPAVLTLVSGTASYTGLPLEATLLTEPEGLAFQVEYRDEEGNEVFSPVESGRYTLVASIDEANYIGSMETPWEILPAHATLFFDELNDGLLRIPFSSEPIDTPAVSTHPEGLSVSITYEDLRGSDPQIMETPPVERGLYRATATVSDPNYIGSLHAELLLGERPVSFAVPEAVEGQVSRIFSGVRVILPRIVSDPAGIPFQLEFEEQSKEGSVRNNAPTDVGIYEVRILPTQPYDIGSATYLLNILPQMEEVVFTPPEEVAPGTPLDLAAMLSTLCSDFLSVELISGPLHQTGITVWEQPGTSFTLSSIPDAFSLGVEEMDLNFVNGIALLKTGEVVYWGNLEGSFQPPAGRTFTDIAAGSRSVAALDDAGFLHFAGSGAEINPPEGVQGIVTAIAAGNNSYHVILKNGTVRSWGFNSEGDFPQMPSQNEPVVAIRADSGLAGALDAAGQVHLWGHSFVDTVFAVPNFGGKKVQRLELTSTGALALTEEGELFTWGNPPGNAPPPSSFVHPLVDIALSLSHAHAIDEAGALISWGSNPTMIIHPEEITNHARPVLRVWAAQDHVFVLKETDIATVYGRGEAHVRYTLEGCPNFADSSFDHFFRVGSFPSTITFLDAEDGSALTSYTGLPQAPSLATHPESLAVAFSFTGLTAEGTPFGPTATPPTGAGVYEVTVTSLDSFHPGEASLIWEILSAAQSISFHPNQAFALDAQPLLEASASSGLPVSFEIVSGPARKVSTDRIRFTDNKPVVVRALQAGNANYLAAPPVERTLHPQAPASISFLELEPVYTGDPLAPAIVTDPAGLNVVFTFYGHSEAPVDPGVYEVTATIEEDFYRGSAAQSLFLQPQITFSSLAFTYTGNRQNPTVDIEPFFNRSISYEQSGEPVSPPQDAGIWTQVVRPLSDDFDRTYRVDFEILKGTFEIVFMDSALTVNQSGSLTAFIDVVGSTVSFEVMEGRADLSGSQITPRSAGPLTIRARATGTHNYHPPEPVERTFFPAYTPVALSFNQLEFVYSGFPVIPDVTLNPDNATHRVLVDGGFEGATDAGTYRARAEVMSSGFFGELEADFVIKSAPATLALAAESAVYTGAPQPPVVSVQPTGLTFTTQLLDREGNPIMALNAGTYTLLAEVDERNYTGTLTATYTIHPAAVDFTFNQAEAGLIQFPFNGEGFPELEISVSPAGIPYTLGFRPEHETDGDFQLEPPTGRGRYVVRVSSADPNFAGSEETTLVYGAREVTFALQEDSSSEAVRVYDGNPVTPPAISVHPADAEFSVTYSGTTAQGVPFGPSLAPPTDAGTYIVYLVATHLMDTGEESFDLQVLPRESEVTFTPPADVWVGASLDPLDWLSISCPDRLTYEILSGPVENRSGAGWGQWWSENPLNMPASMEKGWTTAVLGDGKSLAILTDGTLVSWGEYDYDALIAELPLNGPAIDVALSINAYIILDVSGQFHNWSNPGFSLLPAPAGIQGHGVSVVGGRNFFLALLEDGTLAQWGFHPAGQNVPTSLSAGGTLTAITIAAGSTLAGAVDENGAVHLWGEDAFNSGVLTIPESAQSGVVALELTSTGAMALREDGTVVTWGFALTPPEAIQGRATAIALALGHAHAIRDDGILVSWGNNSSVSFAIPDVLTSPGSQVLDIVAAQDAAMAQYRGSVWAISGPGDLTVRYTRNDCPNTIDFVRQETFRIGYDGVTFSFPDAVEGTVTSVFAGSELSPKVDSSPAGVAFDFTFTGMSSSGALYGPTSQPPTQTGIYQVDVSSADPLWKGEGTVAFSITEAPQTLPLPSETVFRMSEVVTLPEFSSAGLAITYSIVEGPGILDGNLLTYTGSGPVLLRAEQPGDLNYFPAEIEEFTLTAQAPVSLSLFDLEQTFDGTPRPVEVVTQPSGLNVILSYHGSPTPPTLPGTYIVTANVQEGLFEGSLTQELVIVKAVPEVSLLDVAIPFTGSTQMPVIQTQPAGLPLEMQILRNGEEISPVHVGTYSVRVSIETPEYQTEQTLAFRITPVPVEFTLSELTAVYDFGNLLYPTAAANPSAAGVRFAFFQDGVEVSPVDAGTYTVEAFADSPNFSGSQSTEFVIQPRPISITVADQVVTFDGEAHLPTVQTQPDGIPVGFAFEREGEPVAEARETGVYTVTAFASNSNFTGSDSAVFTILPAEASFALETDRLTYTGEELIPVILSDPPRLSFNVLFFDPEDSGNPMAIPEPVTPMLPGSYLAFVQLEDSNYQLSPETGFLEFEIEKAEATLIISNTETVFDGSPQHPTVVTVPDGLEVEILYLSEPIPVTEVLNAGPYPFQVHIIDDRYRGEALGTLTIQRARANVIRSPHADVTRLDEVLPLDTDPGGLTVNVEWLGLAGNQPTQSGRFAVRAAIDDPNFFGEDLMIFDVLTLADWGEEKFQRWLDANALQGGPMSPPVSVIKNSRQVSLREAFLLGDDPNDPEDVLSAGLLPANAAAERSMQFRALPGRRYQIEVSDDLTEWRPHGEPMVPDGQTDKEIDLPVPDAEAPAFFRLRVDFPE